MRNTRQPAPRKARFTFRSRSRLRDRFAFQNALCRGHPRQPCFHHSAEYPPSMLDWSECKSVERVPERVSGAWVFKGTRLPVRTLFENIEAGATVDDFLAWYEGVAREQVLDVLRHAERSLAAA